MIIVAWGQKKPLSAILMEDGTYGLMMNSKKLIKLELLQTPPIITNGLQYFEWRLCQENAETIEEKEFFRNLLLLPLTLIDEETKEKHFYTVIDDDWNEMDNFECFHKPKKPDINI